jgi:hypothetical protein
MLQPLIWKHRGDQARWSRHGRGEMWGKASDTASARDFSMVYSPERLPLGRSPIGG